MDEKVRDFDPELSVNRMSTATLLGYQGFAVLFFSLDAPCSFCVQFNASLQFCRNITYELPLSIVKPSYSASHRPRQALRPRELRDIASRIMEVVALLHLDKTVNQTINMKWGSPKERNQGRTNLQAALVSHFFSLSFFFFFAFFSMPVQFCIHISPKPRGTAI
jgi:hypothetical protein